MKIEELQIPGVVLIEGPSFADDRGSFTRLLDRDGLAEAGLSVDFDQASVSRNIRRGTLRGMHWQDAPHAETKLVSCTRGAVYDVVVDLRPGDHHRRWVAVELRGDDARTLHVPAGCAHGFQTLEPDSDVHYLIAGRYVPEAARGVRFDDPAFSIDWPPPPPEGRTISTRDAGWPLVGP